MKRLLMRNGKPPMLMMEMKGSLGETHSGKNICVNVDDTYIMTEFVNFGEKDDVIGTGNRFSILKAQLDVNTNNLIRAWIEMGHSDAVIMDRSGKYMNVLDVHIQTYDDGFLAVLKKMSKFKFTFVNKYTHHAIGIYDEVYDSIEEFDIYLKDIRDALIEEMLLTKEIHKIKLDKPDRSTLTHIINKIREELKIPDPDTVACVEEGK